MTKRVAQSVCHADNLCVLKPLPGAPSYSLANLEESTEELANLNPCDYFMKVAGIPMYNFYMNVKITWKLDHSCKMVGVGDWINHQNLNGVEERV